MMIKSSKSLLVVVCAVFIGLLFLLGMDIYNVRAKNIETSRLHILADSAAEAEISARSIRALQKDSAEDLAAFDNIVLTSNKLVPLIESIEAAGRRLGLETSILSVGDIDNTDSSQAHMIRIVMETHGPWAKTLSFLRAIESLPQRVMIEESNLTSEEFSWRSRIVLSLYVFN